MGDRAWGMGDREWGDEKDSLKCPISNAQCPIPNSQLLKTALKTVSHWHKHDEYRLVDAVP